MPKQKKINKTAAVENFVKEHPDADAKRIVAELAKHGVSISAGAIHSILYQLRNTGRIPAANGKVGRHKAKPARKADPKAPPAAPVPQVAPVGASTNGSPGPDYANISHLVAAREFLKEVGGLYHATKALDVLEQLEV